MAEMKMNESEREKRRMKYQWQISKIRENEAKEARHEE